MLPGRQFAVLRQFMGFHVPAGAGVPEDVLLGSDSRVLVQGAGRNHYVLAAFDMPGQGRATVFAKAGGKVFGVWKFKSPHPFLPRKPTELLRGDEDVGCVGTAGELAAALAVTVLEDSEGGIDLVADAAA